MITKIVEKIPSILPYIIAELRHDYNLVLIAFSASQLVAKEILERFSLENDFLIRLLDTQAAVVGPMGPT